MSHDITVNLTQMWLCNIQDEIDTCEDLEVLDYSSVSREQLESECLETLTQRYEYSMDFEPFSVDYPGLVYDTASAYGMWRD